MSPETPEGAKEAFSVRDRKMHETRERASGDLHGVHGESGQTVPEHLCLGYSPLPFTPACHDSHGLVNSTSKHHLL